MILCKEEVKQLNMRSREMSASLLEQIHVTVISPIPRKSRLLCLSDGDKLLPNWETLGLW